MSLRQLLLLPLLALGLAAAAPAATVADCLASPTEHGLPPLRFGVSANASEPLRAHDWQLPGGQRLRADMLHIIDYGTAQACAILQVADGHRHALPLEDMLPGDRLLVERWVKEHGFIELALVGGGSLCARVEELITPSFSFSIPLLEIQLSTPDGRQHFYCCNAEAVTPAEVKRYSRAIIQGRSCIFFTEAGLERLRAAAAVPKAAPAPKPVFMAASPAEAIAYAELNGLTVVTLYLNQRGSENDLAWWRYLERYPEAGSYWNSKYVFVGVYCDEQGNYPPELLQEIRASVCYGTCDSTPPAALRMGSARQQVPRLSCSPPCNNCYTIADFLNTPPDKVSFGSQH